MNEEMVKKGVIYKYTFPNGKVYIGQTRRDPEIRHREHLDPKIGPSNSAFWAAYQEQGEPKYEILEKYEFEDVDQLIRKLNERETYHIYRLQAANPAYGYNIMPRGTVSLEMESKLRGLSCYYFQQLMSQMEPIFDAIVEKIDHEETMTEDEKELYQDIFVRKNMFADVSKDDEDFFVERCDFARFVMEEDLRILADEYVHENAAQLLENIIDENTIYQLSKEGEIVDKFNSQIEAAQAMGAKTSANINNVIVGKQKTAYGYKWVRAFDYLETKKKLETK